MFFSDQGMMIQNIYAITRPVENVNFTDQIDNKQMLFHASKVENMAGILSR